MKILSVVLGLALLTSSAHAQANRTSADARRVFDEMRAKYATFQTYSHSLASSEFESKSAPANSKSVPFVATFAFRHPNRFAGTFKNPQRTTTRVSNGRTLYAYSSTFNKTKYHAIPMPDEKLGRIGLLQYDAAGYFVTPLLAGIDPYADPRTERANSFAFGKPTKINGVPVDVVVVRLAGDNNAATTYFIGQKDRLLYGFKHASGKGTNAYTVTETYKDIRVNPKIPIDTFAFVPPPNTQWDDETKWYFGGTIPDNLKVGAVPPSIEGTDLQGRTVRLEDYKGKVVLLDFWATWCGPCVVETPYIKAAYDKFHDQGFEVLGISFDQDRKALEKYISEKKLPWTQLYDGKMFEGEIGKSYKIRGIPTYYLIGRDGKIAEFNPQKLLLEPAIEKALSTPAP